MTAHHLRAVTREAEALAASIAATYILATLPVDPKAEEHREALIKGMGWQCIVHGCTRQARAVAMCDSHYRAFRATVREREAS